MRGLCLTERGGFYLARLIKREPPSEAWGKTVVFDTEAYLLDDRGRTIEAYHPRGTSAHEPLTDSDKLGVAHSQA